MLDKQASNELKILALETINNAGSGHSGAVLSCGDILYTLYTKHLLRDISNDSIRDRFVLSNGHACAILYSILAGLGYFDINELKNFRSFGGRLTGHPEIEIAGIDASTGPLGQGVANAVGMAIAETILNEHFSEGHYTYCMCGDGCLQEGVALEALSVAGLHKLNKFILLYDKNNITLDGTLKQSSTDDMVKKFKALNFNVIQCDGHNIKKIDSAITKAKQSKDKPTIIIFNTIIGKDTSVANSNKAHGKVYSNEEINLLRNQLNVTSQRLNLSDDVKYFLSCEQSKIVDKFKNRKEKFEKYLKNNKKIAKKYENFINSKINLNIKAINHDLSLRELNNLILNEINKTENNIVCLNADLSSSTKVKFNNQDSYSYLNRKGKNISVGIREHAMGAIANGIALHGGLRVVTSTFLAFSNYMLPAIRMACIMKLPVMFVFSHTSVYETIDGVTHLPVEQLDQLRLMPNIVVSRPCNFKECLASYNWWLKINGPICLCLSRATITNYKTDENVDFGAYYLINNKSKINILSSGSEVELAVEVGKILNCNVVSVPSLEIFEMQTSAYKRKILNKELFVVESSTCYKYLKYINAKNIFGVYNFGKTGDSENLKKDIGFDANLIANKIKKQLNIK